MSSLLLLTFQLKFLYKNKKIIKHFFCRIIELHIQLTLKSNARIFIRIHKLPKFSLSFAHKCLMK